MIQHCYVGTSVQYVIPYAKMDNPHYIYLINNRNVEKRKDKPEIKPACLLSAKEEIRTPTPGKRRYHLKVVRLPISPPSRGGQK